MTDSNHKTNDRPLFTLGSIVATPGALEALEHAGKTPAALLARHQCGDWGDLSADDRRENEFSLGRHLRIFSTYLLDGGVKIWVITEADRSATTLLLPSEY